MKQFIVPTNEERRFSVEYIVAWSLTNVEAETPKEARAIEEQAREVDSITSENDQMVSVIDCTIVSVKENK